MASKRHLRRKGCTGKQRYPDERSARVAIAILSKRQGHPVPLNRYTCPFCGALHVGHQPKEKRYA